MKKIPHFKPDTVIGRGEFTLPVKEMLENIARRRNFAIDLSEVVGNSKRQRVPPIMAAINRLEKKHKARVMRELFWLNSIGATEEVAATMFGYLRDNSVEIPACVRDTTFQDQVAWAYPRLETEQWERLITLTNFQRISSNDWTQLLLTCETGTVEVDSSADGLTKIRESVCSTLNNLAGFADDGDCSHYYDETDGCDYFRLDLLYYPELKTILVKQHKFRRRSFQDTVEVDVQYNRRTNMISVCSDLGVAMDRAIAHAWLVGVIGEERARDVNLIKPETETFNLDFIKYTSANLPVPAGSIILHARVVSANTRKYGRSRKGVLWQTDEDSDDLHVLLANSWRANHLVPEDFEVTRIEIAFDYVLSDGTHNRMRCRFSKQKSNYLDAPDELKVAIHALLVERNIINVAA